MELIALRNDAEHTARKRGHRLGRWNTYHGEGKSVANNECVNCGAEVQCKTNKELVGSALSVSCSD